MHLGSIEGNPVRFADWAELQILYSGDRGIALESIRTEADVEGLLGEQENSDISIMPNEVSEHVVAEAVREIERRTANGGRGYPFRRHGDRLELRPGVHRWTPYSFCLMVCDRDYWTGSDPSTTMFEHIASTALQSYLQGRAIRFGAPRDALPQKIEIALDELSDLTGDSRISVYPVQPTDKDLGLDVVGWKDFVDAQTSKVLVYMQCATGEDWECKRGDLDLEGRWRQIISWTTPPVKALAIPYVIPPGREWRRATPGLLLMDRLRISSVLPATSISIDGIDWRGWFKSRVDAASNFK